LKMLPDPQVCAFTTTRAHTNIKESKIFFMLQGFVELPETAQF